MGGKAGCLPVPANGGGANDGPVLCSEASAALVQLGEGDGLIWRSPDPEMPIGHLDIPLPRLHLLGGQGHQLLAHALGRSQHSAAHAVGDLAAAADRRPRRSIGIAPDDVHVVEGDLQRLSSDLSQGRIGARQVHGAHQHPDATTRQQTYCRRGWPTTAPPTTNSHPSPLILSQRDIPDGMIGQTLKNLLEADWAMGPALRSHRPFFRCVLHPELQRTHAQDSGHLLDLGLNGESGVGRTWCAIGAHTGFVCQDFEALDLQVGDIIGRAQENTGASHR